LLLLLWKFSAEDHETEHQDFDFPFFFKRILIFIYIARTFAHVFGPYRNRDMHGLGIPKTLF